MRRASAAAVAALSGFAVMSVELAAVRLFAPYFGDSAYVWTNVIGVMLVALAVGAWLGGRAAHPDRARPRLALVLVVAGAITAIVPVVAEPLGTWLLPSDLALDAAMPALVRGSLAATLLAFALPVLLAGMATPMLIAAVVGREASSVGRAAGLVAMWSTLGSLVGTFATTHVLVPELGSRATVWTCAALWIVAGLLCGGGRKRALALLLPLGLALVPLGARRPPAPPAELLDEVESSYQYLQVVRTPAVDDQAGTTELKINEGLDSFHSVRIDGTPWTDGRYYDFYAVVPLLAGDGHRPAGLRVLSLGAAAGTFERIYRAVYPRCRIDSVELDPAVVALGREYFGAFADADDGDVFAGIDARVFVERSKDRWQVILVDAYERQIYVPAHVASREFFTAVRERLEPGGIVAVNVGGRNFDDPVVQAVGRTMATVFGEAWAWRVPRSRNFMVLGRRGRAVDPTVLESVTTSDVGLARVVNAMRSPSGWRRIEPGEPVLVDDRPFLDELQENALERRIGDDVPLSIGGNRDVQTVTDDVYQRMLASDWEGVLAAATSASRPTGYLRLCLGDARWSLHQVRGALAEFRAAQQLGVDDSMRPALQQRIGNATVAVHDLDRAAWIAARNRWISIGAVLLVALLTAGVSRRLRT